MKTLRLIVIMMTAFTVLIVWNSCKKGPEDPFFSIHSRLSRVTGDWKVTVFQVDFVDSIRRVIDSTSGNGICGPEFLKNIDIYDYRWTFDKNGGFTEKLILFHDTIVDVIDNQEICPDIFEHDSTIKVTVKDWNFTGGVGDFKNKEQLYLFDPEKQVIVIYSIIELREKEMKLETEVIEPDSNVVTLRQYTLTKI